MIFLQSVKILSRDIGNNGASTRNFVEGKHIHVSGWLIDFSIGDESLKNVKTLPNFQNVSNVALWHCFLKIAKCCRIFI